MFPQYRLDLAVRSSSNSSCSLFHLLSVAFNWIEIESLWWQLVLYSESGALLLIRDL